MATIEEWRPWGGNDDASEYAALSTDWPHDETRCPACQAPNYWAWTARAFGAAAGDNRRFGWRRPAREAFRRVYPNRFRGVAEHRRQVRRGSKSAPAAEKHVREEAVRFLVAGLAAARRERIVPPRWKPGSRERYDGPWPYQWPCFEIAQSEAAQAFVTALREAYPARFPEGVKFPFRDPQQYAAALLRAVIADGIVRQAPLSANSPAVRSLIDELHRLVSKEGQTFASIWLIDDVDFSAVDHQALGEVTLHEAPQPQNLVSSLLPEALWAGELNHSLSARHGGFLSAARDGTDYHYDTTNTLNEEIGRVVAAIRLATGSTGPMRMVWIGEPSMIHVQMPEAHRQTEAWAMESFWRRVGVVKAADLPGLRALTGLIEQAQAQSGQGKQATVSSVAIVISRYSRSLTGMSWQDVVLDLATALEACFGPESKEEIGLTLKTRAAHLLGRDDPAKADAIFGEIADLYQIRSDLIHGSARFKRTPGKLFEDRGYTHLFPDDRIRALLDGWRDIVRRAICVRLLLGDARLGPALWPLVGDTIPVDRNLVRNDKREEWCQRLVGEAADLGLPLLVEPAPPLVDELHQEQVSQPVILQPAVQQAADTGE